MTSLKPQTDETMAAAPWLAPESPDLVWFRGEDALRFLNDLVSQQIGDMQPGDVCRSLLLRPDGKLDHILWVIRSGDGFGLVTEPGRGDDLASTLGRYRIRVDVEITREDRDLWLVMGEWSGIDLSWDGQTRTLVIGYRPELRLGSADEYDAARIRAGEPRFGIDVDESTIPQETGLVDSGVDFNKGCFLGQELVARIDARGGQAPRPLRVLDIQGDVEPGAAVLAGDSEVGTLTSVRGDVGLARLKRRVEPGERVRVGGASAIVRELVRIPKT